jgi:acyl-CoA synthetase (AMP-forming)/AMP-acid ligase II
MNTAMLLEMAAQGFADRVAVVNGPDRLTYAELYAAAGAAAARMLESGAKHAGVLDISSLAFPIALFGSARAGLPFVPLNYRLTGDELDRLIERVTPLFLVTDEERARTLESRAGTRVAGREGFIANARETTDDTEGYPMDADAIAVLLFTSGTTGAPKAAVLRHKHLASYILGSVEFGGADEAEATLVSVPPYHVAGIAAVLSSVYSGRRIVQLPSFDAERWLELARTEHVTHAFVVPTMLQRIVGVLEGKRSAELPALRAVSYGGGKMPQSVIERAMQLFGSVDFTNAYGLTETSSTISLLGPDDHRTAQSSTDEHVRRRLTSVGRPLPGLELEIRDEEGRPVPAGQRGEIWVRGEQVSGEYLGRDPTRLADGWFPTRDGGFLDDGGYLFLDGRIDDVIVRGGENLSPGEIEDCLLEHQAVEDCAVVGIPDEQWGEAVAAAIVLKPGAKAGAEELREWVRKHLRSSRAPDCIEFRPELPYNETGKLLRRVVRSELSGSKP